VFNSFFIAGFECSTHRHKDGRRLDLIAATRHDDFVGHDYAAVNRHGLRTVRDGVRWHLIEEGSKERDWSSLRAQLRGARMTQTQVIWDLCHYGWPDDVDIWSPEFVTRFAAFSGATATTIRRELGPGALYCPINEISYFAWAAGETGGFHPACQGQGGELKRQLVRAAVAAIQAVRSADPDARFVTAEPLIHVDAGLGGGELQAGAARQREAQFEALDMLLGRTMPELGGSSDLIDVVGVNYYPDNQWYADGSTIPLGHHAYRPLRHLLAEVAERFGRPLFISETGAEGSARPAWLHYVSGEVLAAREAGVAVEGVCLYPVLDYPGWHNERHCEVGLLGTVDVNGRRPLCEPFAGELARQQRLFVDVSKREPLPAEREGAFS
jgi:hypothetical protein